MIEIAEIEITYSSKRDKKRPLPVVRSSDDSNKFFRITWSNKMEHVEEMYLMVLNRANRVLGISKISMGGVNATLVDPKIVFQTALKANASGIIIAHNHPSGSKLPSESDIRLTRKIREAAGFLEITLLDHLIITSEGYYSFADEGIL